MQAQLGTQGLEALGTLPWDGRNRFFWVKSKNNSLVRWE